MLSRALSSFLLLIAFLVAWVSHLAPPPAPCTAPITYSLGAFDRRFGLSQAEFLAALGQAEAVWEKPLGKNLFQYATGTSPEVAVNLVYDYRQEATQELSTIKGTLKEREAEYQAKKSAYRSLTAEYEALNARYDGTPAEAEQINAVVDQINPLAAELNLLAKELNLDVKEYNAVGAGRGESFAGGTYTVDESGRRIDIYEFSSHEKLVRVLAHELGHALGLEHVTDEGAIMSPVDLGRGTQATPADVSAAKALCGVQ